MNRLEFDRCYINSIICELKVDNEIFDSDVENDIIDFHVDNLQMVRDIFNKYRVIMTESQMSEFRSEIEDYAAKIADCMSNPPVKYVGGK